MTLKKFMPAGGGDTVTLAAATTSARAALDPTSNAVRVVNDGTVTAFISFGDSNVAATASKMPIKAGATEVFTKGNATHVAALVATGTANLYFTSGEGI